MRRFPFAFLLVGVMCLLAAGGAVLGAFQAPTGVDLVVHNDAGETLLASRVVGAYTSSQIIGTVIAFRFTAPDHVSEEALGVTGKVERRQKVAGPNASEVLDPVRALLSLTKFSAHGPYYVDTEPASDLVTPADRAAITGTYSTKVQLAGGYVVEVAQHFDAKDGSQRVTETDEYRLTRVGGWTRPS